MLTDPAFIKQLEMLFLLARKVLGGSLKADRKSDKRGSGILFTDYSDYNQGDDYRSIDWNIYGRMESLVIKLFELEEDVSIHILLDLSHSMQSKMNYAKQLAASLGYIALTNTDRLSIYGLSDNLDTIVSPSHGKSKIFSMLESLEKAECYGADTQFTPCLKTFQKRHKRPGVCVLISDFFTPDGYEEALKFLRWSRHDIFCLQVLDPKELDCDWKGDIDLHCVETGKNQKVTIGPNEIEKYKTAMKDWNDKLTSVCSKQEIGFSRARTDIPFEEIIQYILRRGGLVS